MAKISFTSNLKRFFPSLTTVNTEAQNVAEALDKVEETFPGLKSYLLKDDGSLRDHVNLFIGDEMVKDRVALQDCLKAQDQLFIMQAISGG